MYKVNCPLITIDNQQIHRHLRPLFLALAAPVVLCFLPKWLMILLIIIFVVISAIFFGASTAWLLFQYIFQQIQLRLAKDLIKVASSYWEKRLWLSMPDDFYSSRLLVSRDVDSIIKDIMTRIFDDNLFKIIKGVTCTPHEYMKRVHARLINETWFVVSKVIARLRMIDEVKLLTEDFVDRLDKHFKKLNRSHVHGTTYLIPAYLTSDETEKDYLRRVADVFVHAFIPQSYMTFHALRHILREILAVQIFFRAIRIYSDSNYLNRRILMYIASRKIKQRNRPTEISTPYIYAENFDQFVKVIEETCDLDQLNQMKYIIINEIIQATRIHNMKKEYQTSTDPTIVRSSVEREDLLNRDLPTYLHQLGLSFSLCEKKISTLTFELNPVDSKNTDFVTMAPQGLSQGNYSPQEKIHPFYPIIMDQLENEEALKDDIAEPTYAFFATLFDLEGNTSWLRKSLIALVQITYRETVNKKFRETVNWLVSESMFRKYLSGFRDTLWPADTIVSDSIPQYDDIEGDKLYDLTKVQLIQNLPDIFVNLLGEATIILIVYN